MVSLQNDFDFTFPDLYWQLYNDGMLSASPVNTEDTVQEFEISTAGDLHKRQKALNGIPEFLCEVDNFRMLTPEQIRYRLTETFTGEVIDPKHKFIPFGLDHASYWYAFSFNQRQGDDVPVVLVWRDSDTVTMLAKNLQDFIFSAILWEATFFEDGTDLEEKRKGLFAMLESHSGYMKPQHVNVLKEIFARPFISEFHKPSEIYEYTDWKLLTQQEAEKIELQEINFEFYNHEFEYMRPV